MANPQLEVKVVTSGGQADVVVVGHGDNVGQAFGGDKDFVIVLNSAGLAADAELTDVIVGTSDHQGIAANSAILSNITDDGDIIMLVSDGGNSKEFLRAKGSTADLQLGHGMATVTIKTATGDLTLNPAGDIDASSKSVLNHGASGNDWTATEITHKGSGINRIERTSAVTNTTRHVLYVIHTTTEDMVDGFGPTIRFVAEDPGAAEQNLGHIKFVRAGADNTGEFIVGVSAGGTANDGFKVDSVGELYADLDGSGGSYLTNGVNLFDEYDDPRELQRYAHIQSPFITEAQRQANRDRMLEIGVIERKNTGPGYYLKLQTFSRLLAGGVYQNGGRLDEHETRFSTVEDRIAGLEEAQDILRAQVVALGSTPEA